MKLIKDRFGIEQIVASNIIEKAINSNNSQTIRAILGMDPRFTPGEIESIVSLSEEEHRINMDMVAVTENNDIIYSYRNPYDASKIGKALAEFFALRNQKSSLFSKASFLPTYAMYTAKNLSNTAYATIAVTGAVLAYAAYRRRANL